MPARLKNLRPSAMSRLSTFVIAGALAVLAGGLLFLALWDIPPPSAEVEKILPDDRFPR